MLTRKTVIVNIANIIPALHQHVSTAITFSDLLRGAFSPAGAGLQPRNTKQSDGSFIHMLHS